MIKIIKKIYPGSRTENKTVSTLSLLLLMLFFLSPPTSGADEISELRESIQRQQEEIDSLFAKLGRIEDESESKFGWNLGLFGDVNFSTNGREQSSDAFFIDEIAIFSSVSRGERLNGLLELAIEQEDEAADIERLWIGYSFSDLLTIRAGKFHTALGHWNRTYHHGKQLFLTVDRPFFLSFDKVMPGHIMGVELVGRKALDFGNLKYELQFGNGPRLKKSGTLYKLSPNSTSDDNSSKQPILRVSMKPNSISGLGIGLFATTYKVDTPARSGLNEKIYGVDLQYVHNSLELISELFLFHNSDAGGNAFYVQLAQTKGDWTTYVRFESLNVKVNDPYLSSLNLGKDRSQSIVGVKYNIDPVVSGIKLQYRRDNGSKDYSVIEAQWSFHL